MIAKLLSTSLHDAPGRAHVIKDWPYGRTLRCEKHVWIETRKNFGQRVVYRTTNPKRGNTFNAPKAGNYSDLCLFGEDKDGMLTFDGLNRYSAPEKFASIRTLPLDSDQVARVDMLEKESRQVYPQVWEGK